MHMADALVSPLVGGVMLAATAGLAAYSANKIQKDLDDTKIPLMGVMGAFVFAAQMINFTIPATGSSGHLAGGMLLSALLGPQAGFLTMASVLLIQALFFGDGGLLAFGCNVINLAFFTCFFAYPLIYRSITRRGLTARRIFTAAMLSSIVGLQLGSLGVVIETVASGKTELPIGPFLLLMQAIHLAIGVIEGLVTAAIVTFVWKARPDIFEKTATATAAGKVSRRKILAALLATVVIMAGVLSWFASTNPDGLEWALQRIAPQSETGSTAGKPAGSTIAATTGSTTGLSSGAASITAPAGASAKPGDPVGTSLAGLVGGALTLMLAAGIGWLVSRAKRKRGKATT